MIHFLRLDLKFCLLIKASSISRIIKPIHKSILPLEKPKIADAGFVFFYGFLEVSSYLPTFYFSFIVGSLLFGSESLFSGAYSLMLEG